MENCGLRRIVVRKAPAFVLCACACFASRAHAQSPPSARTAPPALPPALQALGARIDDTLTQSRYGGLDQLQRNAAATSAAMMVDAGRCSDPSAAGSAAETLLFTFDGLGRKLHQPIFDLPDSSKSVLIDFAMDLESQRQPAQDLTSMICHEQTLPESATKPLAERRAAARQVLALALSPQKPAAPASQPE